MPRTDHRPTCFTFSEVFTLSLGGLVLSTAVLSSPAFGNHAVLAQDWTGARQQGDRSLVRLVSDRDHRHSLIRRPSAKSSTGTERSTDTLSEETNTEKRSKTLLKRPSTTSTQKTRPVAPSQATVTTSAPTVTTVPSSTVSPAPTQSTTTTQTRSMPSSSISTVAPRSLLGSTTGGVTVGTASTTTTTTSLTAATSTTTSTSSTETPKGSGRKFSQVLSQFPEVEEAVKTKGKGSNGPPQTLNVSPTALVFSATAGSGNPPSQAFSVSKSGGGPLSWTASENAAWLSLSSSSGGNNQTVSVSVNTSGLPAGIYSTPITVSASGASNSPQTVLVSLAVNAAQVTVQPKIGLSPSSLAFTATQGGANPANQTVAVTNTGTGTLTWTVADNVNWLTATQSGSSIVAGVNLSGLAAGTYNGAITVSASGATNTPQTIPVSLTVAAAPVASPTIALSPTSLAFSGTQGGTNPASKTVTVSNTGGGTLTWTASDNANWLTATQSGSSIVAGVNLSGLAAGTYNGAITVSATGATNTPQTIPVTLTVTAAPAPAPTPASSISATPASISITVPAGTTAVQEFTFDINSSGGSTGWSINDPAYWILRDPSSGSTPSKMHGYVYPEFFKTAGTYSATFTITPSSSAITPISVPVTLTVTGSQTQPTQPSIGLSPTSLAFTGTQGGSNPSSKTITVSNTGSGTLSWTVADNANWLTATQSGSSIVAGVNLSGLAAGTYNGVITVSATGATNTPQTIPVALTVTASGSTTTGSVTLTWNANTEQDLGGYKIYRATSSGAYGAPIATINGNVTSYVASGLPTGTTYFFVVTAFDNSGNESSYSNEVSKSLY
ncbi:hypothetical protein DNFV4_02962 [Nitrospira tepida]|uniref:Fibronectin type-III domain-containing protein n=1 Tax=Nitrospira tepida TaxID=2973512 RepID=A0AA86N0N9_9BACT|nr:hypothetical protein DNFV4_02962 [Nitrospira tepida]